MGGGEPVDWAAVVPLAIHPIKVLIVEAIWWVDRPLSASELEKVFGEEMSTSAISYHVVTLAKWGVLKRVEKQRVRGTWRRRYRLANL